MSQYIGHAVARALDTNASEIRDVQLGDRFDLSCTPVLLNGTQAIIRLLLTQSERDRAAGLNTAGYVSGYRGSPLGTVDLQMRRARKQLDEAGIVFEPGVNEDLAATAVWGSQQAELHGEGRHDGVFALWYAKGPGVDRSGDAIKHGNLAGSSKHGGVLLLMGDDHVGESSTTLHQSDVALMDAYVPVLSPAGIQEVVDMGILGYALSRYSGNWVGLKCLKETIESAGVVDGRPDRVEIALPEFAPPPGGLNIRLGDTPRDMEARVLDYRLDAAKAFGRANRIDRPDWGARSAKIGFVAAGKSWLDLQHALSLMDLDRQEAERLGIATYKVGMTWPFETKSFLEWAEPLDLVVIVEEKRKLVEMQAKDALFDAGRRPRVYGARDREGRELFPVKYALDPIDIARKLGRILDEEGRGTERLAIAMNGINSADSVGNAAEFATRTPYFCSGCPHSTSTRIPEGARAYAGIGCHFLVQWMDRNSTGYTQMGGEGSNWIGENPFSKRGHVFQNMGDGTYNHSGVNSVRAAVAANANITFKILFNDAVAMTGGQGIEGGLDAARVAHELAAFGVRELAVVYDRKEDIDLAKFPKKARVRERGQLDEVQRDFQKVEGVTAIVYVQTCAAEKRRRRKRGQFPDTGRRAFINTDICEGCGDCGVQSNCVSIVPVETEFGRKRAVDQSGCNQDFSCLNGFCPSFVTIQGAAVRARKRPSVELPPLPAPKLPEIDRTYNLVIGGIGGTGVLTIDGVLAMAAHLDRLGVGVIQMLGFAQKGGAVTSHCRIARTPEDITAIRVADNEADAVLSGDLVVAASAEVRRLMSRGRTRAVVNLREIVTGEFTRNKEFRLPTDEMRQQIEARTGEDSACFADTSALAEAAFGDSIYSNIMLLGMAWQNGWVPLSHGAIARAIELNGVSVELNRSAFELGRLAAHDPEEAARVAGAVRRPQPAQAVSDPVELRRRHVAEHSGAEAAAKFQEFVDRFGDSELKIAAAEGYHRVIAVKDEYEVARLHGATAEQARREFAGDFRMTFHLAPPGLAAKGADGRPGKREFGQWILVAFRLLAAMRWMRGTVLDPFARGSERRLQRELRKNFESDMAEILAAGEPHDREAALELAALPTRIRGFGPVWEESYRIAMNRRDELLRRLRTRPPVAAAIAAE